MRIHYLYLLVAIFTLCIGCGGGGSSNGSSPPDINRNAQAYFPLNVGDIMTYIIVKAPDNNNLWSTTEPHTYTVSQIQLELEGMPPETVYSLDLTPIPLDGPDGDINSGLLCKGTRIIGSLKGVGGYASMTSADLTILPNPTPNVGDSWILAAAFGNWCPSLPLNIDDYISIQAIAKLSAVENITVQGHVYTNTLRIDVTGEIYTYVWPEGDVTIIGLGSYWLAENVGVVAIEANCGGFFTDSVRIERLP